ncbi:hypothetical protein F0562_028209 [Nyssa sinensis]|uniref:Tyrosine-protein phosphatase domain-containing protein n=1 Tax=Nyssa sinensis TaxID=561372 RepID=A0A5J5BA04_9ASTE|nr:hypothetical protein F0562_028209 [Nyssa sinensis]
MRPLDVKNRCSVAVNSVNYSKNRYTNVLPFDTNRVVLNPRKDNRQAAQGYINASFIRGPLPYTLEDFWEMMTQYHCPVIVMLTRLVDNYKMVKCGDYFQAEDGPREFHNISIVTKWIRTSDNSLVLRNLEVKYKESEEPPLVCFAYSPRTSSGALQCSEMEWFRQWSNSVSAMMLLLMSLKTSSQSSTIKGAHNAIGDHLRFKLWLTSQSPATNFIKSQEISALYLSGLCSPSPAKFDAP